MTTLPFRSARVKANRPALQRLFLGMGFTRGKPDRISDETLQIDLKTARRLKCPGCNRRSMRGCAFKNGWRYRVIATCQRCRAEEEV